jgi:hypothetical protein
MSDAQRRMSITSQINGLPSFPFTPFSNDPRGSFFGSLPQKSLGGDLPRFIKPLPAKIGPDEISYLERKGALTVPRGTLRSEMLRAYVEFVHPYMPLLDLHDFLSMIDRADGSKGKVSLILFQAVMFAGSAFVDMQYLRAAGYATRKEARKDFFQKTRVRESLSGIFEQCSAEHLMLDVRNLWFMQCLLGMHVNTAICRGISAIRHHRAAADLGTDPVRFRLRVRSRIPRAGPTVVDLLLRDS